MKTDDVLDEVPVTFEAWVKFAANATVGGTIWGSYPGTNGKFVSLEIQDTGYPRLCWSDSAQNSGTTGDIKFTSGSVFTGEWVHITIVYDANTNAASYYLNGEFVQTLTSTKTGKLTVVNFWGTWCTPCVNELPYFDQIARDYEGKVTVIAIHTDMVHTTAPAFIAEKYPDSPMCFAKDYVENNIEGYFTALGGQDAYPYTVILDENGVILEKFPYPLHYEDLQNAITPHLP